MQQRDVGAELVAHRLEHAGEVVQVGAGVPVLLDRLRAAARGLVVVAHRRVADVGALRGDAVDRLQRRHAGLHADRLVPLLLVRADRVEQLGQLLAGRVPVGHQPVAARAAEQLVDRHPGRLALDVPQRHVDRRDRRHRHRARAASTRCGRGTARCLRCGDASAPISSGTTCSVQVRDDGELAAVEGRVAEAGESVVGRDLQRHEVAIGAGDDDVGLVDDHVCVSISERGWRSRGGDEVEQTCHPSRGRDRGQPHERPDRVGGTEAPRDVGREASAGITPSRRASIHDAVARADPVGSPPEPRPCARRRQRTGTRTFVVASPAICSSRCSMRGLRESVRAAAGDTRCARCPGREAARPPRPRSPRRGRGSRDRRWRRRPFRVPRARPANARMLWAPLSSQSLRFSQGSRSSTKRAPAVSQAGRPAGKSPARTQSENGSVTTGDAIDPARGEHSGHLAVGCRARRDAVDRRADERDLACDPVARARATPRRRALEQTARDVRAVVGDVVARHDRRSARRLPGGAPRARSRRRQSAERVRHAVESPARNARDQTGDVVAGRRDQPGQARRRARGGIRPR